MNYLLFTYVYRTVACTIVGNKRREIPDDIITSFSFGPTDLIHELFFSFSKHAILRDDISTKETNIEEAFRVPVRLIPAREMLSSPITKAREKRDGYWTSVFLIFFAFVDGRRRHGIDCVVWWLYIVVR